MPRTRANEETEGEHSSEPEGMPQILESLKQLQEAQKANEEFKQQMQEMFQKLLETRGNGELPRKETTTGSDDCSQSGSDQSSVNSQARRENDDNLNTVSARDIVNAMRESQGTHAGNLPKFSENYDPLLFLDEVEFYRENRGWTEQMILGSMGQMFPGQLQHWWIRNKRDLCTFAEFKDRFLKTFMGPDYLSRLERMAMNLVQGEKEPVTKFVLRMESLCRHIDPLMPDRTVARKVLHGLNPNLRALMRLSGNPTLNEVEETAQEAQSLHFEIQKYNHGKYRNRAATAGPTRNPDRRAKGSEWPTQFPRPPQQMTSRERGPIICFKCSQPGHKADRCTQSSYQNYNANRPGRHNGTSNQVSGIDTEEHSFTVENAESNMLIDSEKQHVDWEEILPLESEESKDKIEDPCVEEKRERDRGPFHRPVVRAGIGDWEGLCLIDTGADESLIATNIWELVKGTRFRMTELTGKSLRSANGSLIKVTGEVVVPITIADRVWRFKFTVVDNIDGDVYLGWDFCQKTGLTVLPSSNTYTFGEGEFPLWQHGSNPPTSGPSANRASKPEVSEEFRKEVGTLLEQFKDVMEGPPTAAGKVEFKSQLTTNETFLPRTYPLSPPKRLAVEKQLHERLTAGIIRKSTSNASPFVLVRKGDDTHRFCGDFRNLNTITVPEMYTIPHIRKHYSRLEGDPHVSEGTDKGQRPTRGKELRQRSTLRPPDRLTY